MKAFNIGGVWQGHETRRGGGRGAELGDVGGAFTDASIVRSSGNTSEKETKGALSHRKGTRF